MQGVEDLHLGSDLVLLPARTADTSELQRVHSPEYLTELERRCLAGGGALDPDTYATHASWDASRLAAGAGLVAIEALSRAGTGAAFVVARPPGHHALADRSMGFCLINNVAVAAASLAASGERVLIVDWDVHHGNGTQALFWDEPDVLYVSTHQWPFYPGSGHASEVGGESAAGTTVNVPLPAGATGDVLRHAFDRVIGPIVSEFAPSWVLVSAGFDAHRDDPLAELDLVENDFIWVTQAVCQIARTCCGARVVSVLEGGYDLEALARSTAAHIRALMEA